MSEVISSEVAENEKKTKIHFGITSNRNRDRDRDRDRDSDRSSYSDESASQETDASVFNF